jgi:hypothetical protein
MTELSPSAQSVLNACNEAVERLPLTAEPEQFSVVMIAAALRAAADQVVPAGGSRKNNEIRDELLAIATELEGND